MAARERERERDGMTARERERQRWYGGKRERQRWYGGKNSRPFAQAVDRSPMGMENGMRS